MTPVPRAPVVHRGRGGAPELGGGRGYRRRLAPQPRRDLRPGPPSLGRASVDCPTCRARWEDGTVSFWDRVLADGSFPGRCPACGGSLPEWSVINAADRAPCLRPTPTSRCSPSASTARSCSPPGTTGGSCARARRSHTSSHLLAVASLVLEMGGDEDEAIGALLHDAVEDGGGRRCSSRSRRSSARRRPIVARELRQRHRAQAAVGQRKRDYIAAIAHKAPANCASRSPTSCTTRARSCSTTARSASRCGIASGPARARRSAGTTGSSTPAFAARRDASDRARTRAGRVRPHGRRDRSAARRRSVRSMPARSDSTCVGRHADEHLRRFVAARDARRRRRHAPLVGGARDRLPRPHGRPRRRRAPRPAGRRRARARRRSWP